MRLRAGAAAHSKAHIAHVWEHRFSPYHLGGVGGDEQERYHRALYILHWTTDGKINLILAMKILKVKKKSILNSMTHIILDYFEKKSKIGKSELGKIALVGTALRLYTQDLSCGPGLV